MKHKLILIEGIPGSGKTTVANKTADYLRSMNENVKQYSEGELHPADVAWCAYLTLEEYTELIKKYPEHNQLIQDHATITEDYAIIAYTKLGFYPNENALITYLESKELYQGKVSFEEFKNIHLNLWASFNQNAEDCIYIFECNYFQNHIVELMGVHELSATEIKSYLEELIQLVNSLNPILIYLEQDDINETISRVAKERVSDDKTKWKDWIDLVIEYVEGLKYSKSHHLKGYEGVLSFFKARKKIEIELLEKMKTTTARINNSDYDLDKVMKQVVKSLGK